eukprot:scaffold43380_cov66-Phaeocystis_antarctica.AAC.8
MLWSPASSCPSIVVVPAKPYSRTREHSSPIATSACSPVVGLFIPGGWKLRRSNTASSSRSVSTPKWTALLAAASRIGSLLWTSPLQSCSHRASLPRRISVVNGQLEGSLRNGTVRRLQFSFAPPLYVTSMSPSSAALLIEHRSKT